MKRLIPLIALLAACQNQPQAENPQISQPEPAVCTCLKETPAFREALASREVEAYVDAHWDALNEAVFNCAANSYENRDALAQCQGLDKVLLPYNRILESLHSEEE